MTSPPLLHIACASGFSGDRYDGALDLVQELIQRGGGYLIFETLAERTLALAQLAYDQDPSQGYEPLLNNMLEPVLSLCLQHGIRIVSNFGAANPAGAAAAIEQLCLQLGLRCPRIAIVYGDKLHSVEQRQLLRQRLDTDIEQLEILSANAYIGATEIAAALQAGADIVVAGRVADPSLTVGPAMAHFQWSWQDWQRLARATMAGHLLECGTQVTGGYFAIPGLKEVSGLDRTGFPIATLDHDGNCWISKAPYTGGLISTRTVTEQLLYEVHDPAQYLTPDVIADISCAQLEQTAPDVVLLTGVQGHPRPDELKVNVCFHNGWLAEAEISYAGIQAKERALMAADIVCKRLPSELFIRVDLIGALSILNNDAGTLSYPETAPSQDIRLRLACSHHDHQLASRLLHEVGALYTCGPAGGGGVRTHLRRRISTLSCTIPRIDIQTGWYFYEPKETP
ncbi:acyclic terpene utilization AtuA family protein [Alcaligenes endophyticus]|uniref:DUF1446 domain-containing protein n=1 Tax=Alcaligenes endophyticus TaxID=1929088 RepID=A0ABT8EKV3_9BURK|nr:acyclic terpene utilization AtuA family protein [Alcaligenes endophyticus]MCX5590722.1 DUF1446 domain-containing protein [Alcaligenes endophyticus]MDN4121914.1 DUF1446 domain-containing protein [Alcaligenes endophyticus]